MTRGSRSVAVVVLAALLATCSSGGGDGEDAGGASRLSRPSGSAPSETGGVRPSIGNVVVLGDPVVVAVPDVEGAVRWRSVDGRGAEVATGTGEIGDGGRLPLDHPAGRTGWFRLEVSGSQAEAAETTFAVIPPPVDRPDGRFVVQTHVGQRPGVDAPPGAEPNWLMASLDLVPLAGASGVRDELYWKHVEPRRGTISFEIYDDIVPALRERGLDLTLIVDYGHPDYDPEDEGGARPDHDKVFPYSEEAVGAFARYVEETVAYTAPVLRAVEVWNEPDSAVFSQGPCGRDPDCYVRLLEPAAAASRRAAPDVDVIGPAVGPDAAWLEPIDPTAWMKRFLGTDGPRSLDALTVHPYQQFLPPEGLDKRLSGIDELAAEAGIELPLEVTEIGWSTHTDTSRDDVTTEADQADYVVRAHVVLFAGGSRRVVWYDLMDDGLDRREIEHNWGLVHHHDDPLGAYAPKPAFVSYAVMTRMLAGRAWRSRADLGDGIESHTFGSGGRAVRVLWSTGPGETTVRLGTDKPLVVTDLMGVATRREPRKGAVELDLTGSPVYVEGPVESSQRR